LDYRKRLKMMFGGVKNGVGPANSLPKHRIHTPVEVVSLKDLEMIPQLMAGFVQSLKKGERFKVKIKVLKAFAVVALANI
jgi:hypothetical protein